MMLQLTRKDREELLFAKNLLDNPGLAAKITNIIGSPVEDGIKKLPNNWQNKVVGFTNNSLNKTLDITLFTIKNKNRRSSELLHKVAVGTSGAMGGAGGFVTLPIELPISTTIILRSIIDIARCEGEDINNYDTKLACLEVFALGGKSKDDDGTESGYFAVRTLLASQVNEAVTHIASKGLSKESPILIKLITTIAEKFGVQVSQKAMAQAIPLIGALSGALINTIFIDHFQNMARGHFIIRRLERSYSKEFIQYQYSNILNS
ncbi:MAG: EcsC family protein [Campylobacterota bacterium]|nr:EcsC family protein [Campylobacterota bacterium]